MQLLYQENIPVNQNILYKTMEQAVNSTTGTLDINYDLNSGLIFNKTFNSNLVNYTSDYDNNQNYSSAFEDYIDNQIDWLIKNYLFSAQTIIEIGCGKGHFIKKLAEKLPLCKLYGFDTSYIKESDNDHHSNLQILNEYFDRKNFDFQPDVVICRHVIEHINNPLYFLSEIRASMSDNALLILETPDVNWILDNNVIFDFFYEHCTYFNEISLNNILKKSKFLPISIKHAFNGQYILIVSRASHSSSKRNKEMNMFSTLKLCNNFIKNYECKIKYINNLLIDVSIKDKNIFIWGAGAKGTTFVNYFDKKCEYISALIDINPNKQGKFVGTTAHEVISPENINSKYGKNECEVIILNSNYIQEIKNTISSLNLENITNIYLVE